MLFVGGCGAGFVSFGHDKTLAVDIYGSGQPGCLFSGSGDGCILSFSGSLSFFSLIIHTFHFRVHYFQKLVVGFIIDIFFDDKCVQNSPFFHIPINLNKIAASTVKIKSIFFSRQSVPDKPLGDFRGNALHNLLDVDSTDIIDNPFQFQPCNVYSRSHSQIVYNFIGHQLDVFFRVINHKLKINFFNGLYISISLIIFGQSSEKNHHICFCSFIQFMVYLFIVIAKLRE